MQSARLDISSRITMGSRKFPGKYSSLAEIGKFVMGEAETAGLDEQAVYAVQLAVDEACTNIIEHAYGGEDKGEIEIITTQLTDGIEITLRDNGETFEPDAVPEPEMNIPLEDIEMRGAGIFLIKKMMDEVNYQFGNGGTILKMRKLIKSE